MADAKKLFGNWLLFALKARPLTQRDFAKLIERQPSFVSMVISGQRGPSDDFEKKWLSYLGLKGDAKKRFIELGYLALSPPLIQENFLRLQSELIPLKAQAKRLDKLITAQQRKELKKQIADEIGPHGYNPYTPTTPDKE